MYMLGSQQGRRHSFFQRSESTLCLGCPPPDPFNTPMCESLPLADQPHLLQPNARREDLFGIPKQAITIPSNGSEPPGVNSPLELPPTMLGLSPHRNITQNYESSTPTTSLAAASNATDFESDRAGQSEQSENKFPAVEKTDENIAQDVKLEPTPSTSKDKRKRSDHSESYGNIYMQFKKKSYFDHSEDDSRSYEKGKFSLFSPWCTWMLINTLILQRVHKICRPAKWISMAKVIKISHSNRIVEVNQLPNS